jgi:cysteinyl-tRNA synthetase
VLARAAERDAARAAKDYAAADAIRDELQAAGWVVEDTAQGTSVRRAAPGLRASRAVHPAVVRRA